MFSQPVHAGGLLRTALPEKIWRRIDWQTLRHHVPSAIDAALRESAADVLMSARLEGRTVLIYLLLEHQSSIDVRMPFRLLQYMTRTWERHLEDLPHGALLPPILPVVVAGHLTASQRT